MKTKEIINKYVTYGVAQHNIKPLLKELNLNEEKFYEFMHGQTCGLVGDVPIYYVEDIERFVNGQSVID